MGADDAESLVDGIRADEHGKVELGEPRDDVQQRLLFVLFDIVDRQHGENHRVAAGMLDRRGKMPCLGGRAGDDDVATGKRVGHCMYLHRQRCSFRRPHALQPSAARISTAPWARSSTARRLPSASGSLLSPDISARAKRAPSGLATKPRSQS